MDTPPRPGEPATWSVANESVTTFTWDYARRDDRIRDLSDRAMRRQWSVDTRVGVHPDVAPENPLGLPDRAVPFHGTALWDGLGDPGRREAVHRLACWQLSQFLHGEQAGLICSARIVQSAPDLDLKTFAATQVIDEARHVEAFARLAHASGVAVVPIDPGLERFVETFTADPRWDIAVLAMELLDILALAALTVVRQTTTSPLARDVCASVLEDEARHVVFGRLAIRGYYATLDAEARRERADRALDALATLRAHFHADPVWASLGLDPVACRAASATTDALAPFHRLFDARAVPTLRDLGLLDDETRARLDALGIRDPGPVDLDRASRADDLAARVADAARRRRPAP